VSGTVSMSWAGERVALVELDRPPANFVNEEVLGELVEGLEDLAAGGRCRAVVLCGAGRHFCAGADLADGPPRPEGIYAQAARVFDVELPIVAAVQGAAVGAGLGLALAADFRIVSDESRLSANFARLGFHHGFALSHTLPAAVGYENAADMLFTGRRVGGQEALAMGLAQRLVDADRLRDETIAFACEIAASAPLAVAAIRRTLRAGLGDRARAAMAHEAIEQHKLFTTEDFAEGVDAMAERRLPRFEGR
jgi:2-(1,2-epoxy-1,2-dihydrophenyl)acetyl-CoA isomerase